MSESKIEEIICLLGVIAAFTAYIAGFKIVAALFSAKAIFDMVCAIYYGYKESVAERKI